MIAGTLSPMRATIPRMSTTPPDTPAPHPLDPLLSAHDWKRRLVLWGGAILVALAALLFARLCDGAFALFRRALAFSPWAALAITPLVFAGLSWLTSGALRATRGSGIPQVIASMENADDAFAERNLSLKVSAAKLGLTALALLGGASIGREGPTVHVGASLLYTVGRRFGYTGHQGTSRLLLAGGAAGIAAAFNAPLAGVVFAIEELSSRFEHRFSGTLLTAVIVGGVVSLGLIGSYTYFGRVEGALPLGAGWLAVPLCGIACGLAGGLFARLVLALVAGRPRWFGALRARHPVLLAATCGLILAGLGLTFGEGMFGTGYEQARNFVQGHPQAGIEFGPLKWLANLVSYAAGIPGGLFSPALAVGAGMGHDLALLFPGQDSTVFVLLGMCAYLAGVTQAPLTSAVICMELTDNSDMTLPILATVLLARGASALVCRTPIYKGLAQLLLAAQPAEPPAPATAPGKTA